MRINIMKIALVTAFLSLTGILPAAAADAAAAAGQPEYAGGGPQTCLKCHDTSPPQIVQILKTPHSAKGDPHSPFGQEGCEACHGPSAAHVKSRANLPFIRYVGPNISPADVRKKQCLNCHENGLRMNFQGSAHDVNGKACNDCHTVHIAKDPVLVKATQAEVCFKCHARQRAESALYSHHPIREGKVVCMDCHNPHGSPGDTKLLKEFTVNQVCYNCHAEKRGPMMWEHQPVRDNCLNCHTPHGSNEARLMKDRLNFLCSSCHSPTGTNSGGAFGGAHNIPYGQTGGGKGNTFFTAELANQRMCLNCHSQIHGSNSPSGAFFFR